MCIVARAGSGVGAARAASARQDWRRKTSAPSSFETSCSPAVKTNSTKPSRSCTRSGSPNRARCSKSVLKDDPNCAIVVLGHRADALGQPVRRPALAADDRQRQGGDRQGTRHRIADAAREGLHRRGRDPVFEQRRDDAARSACSTTRRRWAACRSPTRTTSKRGSSGRSSSRRRRRRPTRPTRSNLQAAEMLEPLFKQMPNHPGLAHYIIHAYDVPALAQKALPAARAYAASRRPCRTRSTCRRTRSRASASGRNRSTTNIAFGREAREDQRHRRSDARARLHDLRLPADGHGHAGQGESSTTRCGWPPWPAARRARPAPGPNTFALAAIPARYAMERQQWAEAAALAAAPGAEHAVHRSDHALRARHRRGAQRASRSRPPADIAQLAALRDREIEMKDEYWASRSTSSAAAPTPG